MSEAINKMFHRIELDKANDSCGFEFADGFSCTFDNIATCYDDRLKLYELVKQFQQENQQLKKANDYLQNIIQEYKNPPRYSEIKIDNLKLRQENQQLKERHYLIQGGRGNCKTLVLMLQKENDKYKSVLEEIREYIKEHNDYLEKTKEMYISCNEELLKSSCIQLINNELVRSDNLLQILDKVKGVNK